MTYRTINKNLISILLKSKNQQRDLDKQFTKYKKQMLLNNNTHNKSSDDVNFERYTLNTIYGKISSYIDKKKDLNELKKVLNNTVRNARAYYKQRKQLDKIKIEINATYEYIITHPTKTNLHDADCLAASNKRIFTAEEAKQELSQLPRHLGCSCTLKKIKN